MDYGSSSPRPFSISVGSQKYLIQTQVECHHPMAFDEIADPTSLQLEQSPADEKMRGEYIEIFPLQQRSAGVHAHCSEDATATTECDEDSCSSVACSSLSDLVNTPPSLSATPTISSSFSAAVMRQRRGRGRRRDEALTLDGMSSVETGLESGENLSTSSSISTTSRRPRNTPDCPCVEKASCCSSSGSVSHLLVPECAYASDSGDSCYSSMVNGHLNPR